jgi:CHAT domain-containing protein
VASEPSAALLAVHARRARDARPPVSLLAITDPAADSRDALPGAAREGRSIASLYPRAEIVSRASATKAAFMLAAPEADVVHFAGHATASPAYPLLAHLEFAGESAVGGSPSLEATEIAGMRLDRTRLIVLAACTTAGGQVRRGEGVLSLARPFLIAGAPSVVATLWDIDDAAAALFLGHFHQRYVTGGNAARALRESQTWALHVMGPSTWAAFVSIGVPGLSEF